jgi:hypothetical protein
MPTADGIEIDVISRSDFRDEWSHDYSPGQHTTMLGPTQRGKTRLSHELLEVTVSPEHKCVILAGKPPGRDKTIESAAKRLNLRTVSEWPPEYSFRDRKRNGYVLRPHQTLRNIDKDNENIKVQFRGAILDNYASKKPVITVVDEAHLVHNDLKLKKEAEAPLMRGAPVNAMWSIIQRGAWVSYHCYCEPEHLFVFYDPDVSNRRRYREIGGVDPYLIDYITERELQTSRIPSGQTISQCLYIRRSGPQMMIIDVA